MLICRQKQFIAWLTVLVIILGQFGSVVHAVDHPFHQEDGLCIALQSAELDNCLLHTPAFVLFHGGFSRDAAIRLNNPVPLTFYPSFLSRAPPATSI